MVWLLNKFSNKPGRHKTYNLQIMGLISSPPPRLSSFEFPYNRIFRCHLALTTHIIHNININTHNPHGTLLSLLLLLLLLLLLFALIWPISIPHLTPLLIIQSKNTYNLQQQNYKLIYEFISFFFYCRNKIRARIGKN